VSIKRLSVFLSIILFLKDLDLRKSLKLSEREQISVVLIMKHETR